jgi:hypothetical protein
MKEKEVVEVEVVVGTNEKVVTEVVLLIKMKEKEVVEVEVVVGW